MDNGDEEEKKETRLDVVEATRKKIVTEKKSQAKECVNEIVEEGNRVFLEEFAKLVEQNQKLDKALFQEFHKLRKDKKETKHREEENERFKVTQTLKEKLEELMPDCAVDEANTVLVEETCKT